MRRMNVPCENSTPNTSAPVSVWVSKWTTPTGPWTVAQARIDGSVIEWSPPSTTGTTPAASTWPTVDSIAACERTGSAGMTGASPKSTTRSSAKASTLTSRCGPGGELAPRIARGARRAPGRSETRSSIGAPTTATSKPSSPAAAKLGRDPRSGPLLALRRADVAALGLDLLGLRVLDVGRPPELLERLDQPVGRVELPALEAVPRRGRERVVRVVPALAERHQRDRPVVAALIFGRERPAAVHVADRVHAPRRVVQQEHAHEARPHERRQARDGVTAGEREAEHERDRESEQRPDREQRVDLAHQRVLAQIGREAPRRGALAVEQPAHVRVPQAAQHAAPAGRAMRVRAVRIALLVGECVVLAVIGHPVDDRALDRHRAEDPERRPQPRLGLERTVREQAVEPDRDAEADERVHDREDREVEAGPAPPHR